MYNNDRTLPPMTPGEIVRLGELLKAAMTESRVTYLDQQDEIRRGTFRHGLWQYDGSPQLGQAVANNSHLRITLDSGFDVWMSLAYLTRKFLNAELTLKW